MDRRMGKALVIRALMIAVSLRKPQPSLVCHADCFIQYVSHACERLLKAVWHAPWHDLLGNCWDNAGTFLQ